MFAMSQHHYASYPAAPAPAPPAPRQYSGTSSAFSSSANPDEDWTKISDLAERRRIQNRIAQRNYRKKLKRRLEDLERRAGTSDGASSSGNEKTGPTNASTTKSTNGSKSSKTSTKKQQQQQQQQQQRAAAQPVVMSPPKMPASQFTPPMQNDDEYFFAQQYDDRERSHSPPGLFYAYPPPDDMMIGPYGTSAPAPAPTHHAQAYRPMTTTDAYPEYLVPTTVPVTLPSMTHFSDAIKRETTYGEEMTPYMNYGFIPGMEINAPAPPYDQSNPHTPPLSHGFDHSATCSDSGYEYPTTPLSMPGSPGLIQH